jgi:hypothetical protein
MFRRLDSVSVFRWYLLSWAGYRDYLYLFGQTEKVPLEDRDRIQSLKC